MQNIDWDKALEKFPSQTHASLQLILQNNSNYISRDDTINAALQKYFQNINNGKHEYTLKEKEYREKIASCYSDMFR